MVSLFTELKALGVGLYLHQQSVDTTTPSGEAFLGMASVFADYERKMIAERVHAGLKRARDKGTAIGRPPVTPETVARIRELRAQGLGMVAIGRKLRCGSGTVMRALREDDPGTS